jgi:ClpP class serine protease
MPNWTEVYREIQQTGAQYAVLSQDALGIVRRKYLANLHQHTGRNVIAYYSGFLSKPQIMSGIQDEDKNGFMMAVHGLDRSKGLDLILHTPGGEIAATHSLVDYLHKMFHSDIRAIVPQIAMSAGTMIACCCKEILMANHSNLGPIDPQLRGVPAYGVLKEFRQACREIKKDQTKVLAWQSIIGQYRPTFLSQCQNAIKLSNEFVTTQLRTVMFLGKQDADQAAKLIVKSLTDYSGNKAHDRHIHFEECRKIGLNVKLIEEDQILQDILLTVHHCYMHCLMNTTVFKITENHTGAAFVKQQVTAAPKP